MKVGSLFAGVGGFDLGFERAGMQTAWQVEIDEKCREVLALRFPEAVRFSDVREVGRHNLEPVDVICGGFPCQDLSVAGKRAGMAGARSGLFYEMVRVVAEILPTWVVFENVPGLLSGSDDVEVGDGRCVCGWHPGRGGVHLGGGSEGTPLPGVLGEYDGEGPARAARPRRKVRRRADDVAGRDGKVGGGLLVAGGGEQAGELPAFGGPAPSDQGEAGRVGGHAPRDARQAEQGSAGHQEPDSGVEPTRADGGTASRRNTDCPSCGRDVRESGVGLVRSTWMATVLREFSRIGYAGGWTVVDARYFGVAQRRRRVFGVFTRLDSGARRAAEVLALSARLSGNPAPGRETGARTATASLCGIGSGGPDDNDGQANRIVAHALGTRSASGHDERGDGSSNLVTPALQAGSPTYERGDGSLFCVPRQWPADVSPTLNTAYGDKWGLEDQTALSGGGLFVPTLMRQREGKPGGGKGPLLSEGVSLSLAANGNDQALFPAQGVRRLTPVECCRLQGFPDDWNDGLADSHRYRQMGNAVCVPCAEWIGRRLSAINGKGKSHA